MDMGPQDLSPDQTAAMAALLDLLRDLLMDSKRESWTRDELVVFLTDLRSSSEVLDQAVVAAFDEVTRGIV